MSDTVRAQYEAYPYPSRDPAEEKRRLVTGSPSRLDEVNHYLFQGRRDFARPFRALVAGGGTGDAAIMLAQQLADAGDGGRVTYLDLSRQARSIAAARAEARGLTNIDFLTGSLLETAQIAPGPYDYIDCCGVLHHLSEPEAGLRALESVLAAEGGMGIMVYGTYGRAGVYPLQAMLRQLGEGLPLPERIGQARRLLAALPRSNAFARNPFLGDHERGDAELVDLLLHSQDRSYSVPELLELIAASDLELASFIEPARYDPATYLRDRQLLARLEDLSREDRAAFAERLAGNIKAHVVYLSRRQGSVAEPEDAAIPLLVEMEGARLAEALGRELVFKGSFDKLPVAFPLPPRAPAILRLIGGQRSIAEIRSALQAQDSRYSDAAFAKDFAAVYRVFNGVNRLLLRLPV
ncbi:MAG: class I SAM-dependent methyltransferase [Rhodovibrionaceae bacterium]